MSFPVNQTQRGFTLIEMVIVIVLVGAMMAGMTALFMKNVGDSHRPFLRQKALAVANAFMDEIIRKKWNEASPLGGGCVNTGSGSCPAGLPVIAIGTDGQTRPIYDDIDDYHGINQSPPRDSSDTNMPGYTGFTVNVTVTQPGAWNGIPAADVRLITVNVTSSSNEAIAVSAYRVNF